MRPDEALSAGFFSSLQEAGGTGPVERHAQRRRSVSPTPSEHTSYEALEALADSAPNSADLDVAQALGINPHLG